MVVTFVLTGVPDRTWEVARALVVVLATMLVIAVVSLGISITTAIAGDAAEKPAAKSGELDLAGELARLATLSREAAVTLGDLQQAQQQARDDLTKIDQEVAEASTRVQTLHAEAARLLTLLHRIDRTSPAAIALTSSDPRATRRTLRALEWTRQAAEDRWRTIRAVYDRLAKAKAAADARRRDLTRLSAAVARERDRVALLHEEKTKVRDRLAGLERTEAGAPPADPSAVNLDVLKALVAHGDGPPRTGPPAIATAPGATVAPVAGPVEVAFGGPSPDAFAEAGRSRGIRYSTAPDAVVVAPAAGRVVFAGPFRGYGLLLIVEHDDRYHSILAGFGRISARVGDVVDAGAPVGIMASGSGTDDLQHAAVGADRKLSGYQTPHAEQRSASVMGLYYELRLDGQPVNPMPWLTATARKVTQ